MEVDVNFAGLLFGLIQLNITNSKQQKISHKIPQLNNLYPKVTAFYYLKHKIHVRILQGDVLTLYNFIYSRGLALDMQSLKSLVAQNKN